MTTTATRNRTVGGLTPCDSLESLLPWYCNGSLDRDQRSLVAEHLVVCRACRLALAETRDLLEDLAQSQKSEALLHPLAAESTAWPKVQQLSRGWSSWSIQNARGALKLAAAALVMLCLGYAAGVSRAPSSHDSFANDDGAAKQLGSNGQSDVLLVDQFESGDVGRWLIVSDSGLTPRATPVGTSEDS